MTALITSPMIGASLTQVWKPPYGVTPGASGDATAPFALGTLAMGLSGANGATPAPVEAQFCRVGATMGATATTAGITNGVTTTGATGNTWTNLTGATLVPGDYVFLAAAVGVTP